MVADGEIDVAVVFSILHILEKTLHHRHGNHVADILRDISRIALEGHANDLAILHHRSAAVAGIDGGVDLDGEVGIHSGMREGLEIDPRNDTASDGQPLASDRVSVNGYDGLDLGQAAEFERRRAIEKLGLVDLQQREVAIVRDMEHARGVGLRVAFFGDCQEARVADDMGIRHDPVAINHKSRPHAGKDRAWAPRRFVIGLLRSRLDANKAFSDRCGLQQGRKAQC